MMTPVGRKKPYTQIGIRRLKCTRCGAQANFQWQCCANDNRWLPLCIDCDIELNSVALEFMSVPNRDKLMVRYIEEKRLGK
jgi:hypothetical protein